MTKRRRRRTGVERFLEKYQVRRVSLSWGPCDVPGTTNVFLCSARAALQVPASCVDLVCPFCARCRTCASDWPEILVNRRNGFVLCCLQCWRKADPFEVRAAAYLIWRESWHARMKWPRFRRLVEKTDKRVRQEIGVTDRRLFRAAE